METDNSGAIQAIYNYGNDLISMNRAGVNSYYNYDGLSSTRQLTDSSGAVIASYTYDSFGNVIAQTAGGMASNPREENEIINKAGTSLFIFLGLGLGVVTIRNRKNGLIVLLVILLIADPLPNSMAIEVDVTGNPYGFTGEQHFGEADDLVFLRARYYNPSIGRFISRDPILSPIQVDDNFFWFLPHLIANPQMLNSYVYCNNNPVNVSDPVGMVVPTITIILCGITIVVGIFTLWCIYRIIRAQDRANRERQNQPAEDCGDTQGRWQRSLRRLQDAVRACGIPNYIG